MKNYYSIGLITLLLILLIVGFIATNFISADALSSNPATAGMMAGQTTSTPLLINTSEIGSTDGIFVMGIVIVLIVILPLLFRKK
jgi:beta-lactamase regulating signal transducer with metallopeptidase domain